MEGSWRHRKKALWLGEDILLCGATHGPLLAHHAGSGQSAGRLHLAEHATAGAPARNASGVIWAVLGDGGLVTAQWPMPASSGWELHTLCRPRASRALNVDGRY
jgi:hypothetical protein